LKTKIQNNANAQGATGQQGSLASTFALASGLYYYQNKNKVVTVAVHLFVFLYL
jgi:hypothetical protein